MNGQYIRRFAGLTGIALAALLFAGCAPSIDGQYEGGNGMMTIDIKGDKAKVSMGLAGSAETDVKRDGDKVTLTADGKPLTLTRQSDGSLAGDYITLKKKQ